MRAIICPKPDALLNILSRPIQSEDMFPGAVAGQNLVSTTMRQRRRALAELTCDQLVDIVLDLNERADDLETVLTEIRRDGLPVNQG